MNMRRLGAEPYMDASRRQDILLQIAGMRAKERRVLEVLQSLPSWVERPFQKDQENFQAQFKIYQAAEPTVRAVETRLTTTPGPIWKELTPEEQTAINNWIKSVDQLYAYVNTYFPSETQQYIAQAALVAIAITSFVLPIFLDEPEKGLKLPFSLEPVRFPTRPAPRMPSGAAPMAPPTFSRIPGVSSQPIKVQAEVMRPAASVPTPWRRMETTAQSPGTPAAAPGYRTFTRPLDIPTARVQTPSQAAASVMSPTGEAPPPVAPHGPPTFPRFRRE